MVNLFNSFSSPYDDLVNHLGSSGQGSAQARRKTTNNPNIKVKEANKSDHHEIQIFNKTGYKNFKIEVVKQGQEYYLMVQSSVDRFEKFFKLNPSNDNLQNVKSQIVDDWLIISIPFNAKNQTKTTPKKQTNTPKKQPKSPIPAKSPTPAKSPPPSKNTSTKTTQGKSPHSRTKSPPPSKSSFSKAKSSTKNLFSRGKKSRTEPPSLLEAARRKPFLEEVSDPGI